MDHSKDKEIHLNGIGAAPGIAIGRAYLYSKNVPKIQQRTITEAEVPAELERLEAAIAGGPFVSASARLDALGNLTKHQCAPRKRQG